MKLKLYHIPYLLKDVDRFKMIFIDKTMDRHNAETYGLLETEKSIIVTNILLKRMLFNEAEIEISIEEMDNFFKTYASNKGQRLFINRFLKEYGISKGKMSDEEVLPTLEGILKGEHLDTERQQRCLEVTREKNRAYRGAYRELTARKTGVKVLRNNYVLHIVKNMVEAVRATTTYNQLLSITQDIIDNDASVTESGVIYTVMADNDIHDIRKDEVEQHMETIVHKACIREKLYAAAQNFTHIKRYLVLIVSTKPPHTVYTYELNMDNCDITYQALMKDFNDITGEINDNN